MANRFGMAQAAPKTAVPEPSQTAKRGKRVLEVLLERNKEFAMGNAKPQSVLSAPRLRVGLTEHGQAPPAAIVACADSRASPEIVFGVGLGSLFVIRNAGNACFDDSVIGSLEFCVGNLGTPLIIILGHSRCGAIAAAVEAARNGASLKTIDTVSDHLSKHIYRLAECIKTVVDQDEALKKGLIMNVRRQVKGLKEGTGVVAQMYAEKKVAIVGAVYDMMSGEVVVVDQ